MMEERSETTIHPFLIFGGTSINEAAQPPHSLENTAASPWGPQGTVILGVRDAAGGLRLRVEGGVRGVWEGAADDPDLRRVR
jgi:hypothetical protein